ncbi:MAG TPA: hypothetical protein VJT75_17265 [Thermoleophilaceae bacterium]|nr:hypothetical protein [Thermoleophilaceae bacterium]
MAVLDPVTVTLRQRFQLLHTAHIQRCSVTITAISNAEFDGVVFRTTAFVTRSKNVFTANKAALGLWATVPVGTIEARAPEGVATIEVTYQVKTGADAE